MKSLKEAMETITIPSEIESTNMTEKNQVSFLAHRMNNEIGMLNKDGYECTIENCNNKGYYYVLVERNGRYSADRVICKCVETRKMVHQAKTSGFGDLLNHKLDDYIANTKWQKDWLQVANDYLNTTNNEWLAYLGQSGSGKTMLCSAICNKLLKRHKKVKYMSWDVFTNKLKRFSFDDAREKYLNDFASCEVLYIDDLFKTSVRDGKINWTDVNYGFEIINTRYNRNLATIISSELIFDQLMEIDEATAGRIRERCQGTKFLIQAGKDRSKNYRLKQEA